MKENLANVEIVSMGCQALCKLIATVEAAKQVNREGLVDTIVDLMKENNNWANFEIMSELIKVIVNISGVEENAQPFARHGAVSFLRSIEAHNDNPVFLNNAAMALSKLSTHPIASRHLVKRGAVPVILLSCQKNPQRRNVIARYIRTLTNFLYTEHKTVEEIKDGNGYMMLKQIVDQAPDFAPLQEQWQAFEKAIKMKAKNFGQHQHYSIPIRDRMKKENVRLLSAGSMMRKYETKGKGKKRVVRANDDCTVLLFEDPNGKKAPKQLNLKSVKEIRSGNSSKALAKVSPDCCFSIVAIDPNGREFFIDLEQKSNVETAKWLEALDDMKTANQTAQQQMNRPAM